jgi:hypothetical protein
MTKRAYPKPGAFHVVGHKAQKVIRIFPDEHVELKDPKSNGTTIVSLGEISRRPMDLMQALSFNERPWIPKRDWINPKLHAVSSPVEPADSKFELVKKLLNRLFHPRKWRWKGRR